MLAGAALLYGCALNIKLTPLVMLPAFCLHWMMFESNPRAKLTVEPEQASASAAAGTMTSRLDSWKGSQCVWGCRRALWLLLLCAIPPGANWALLWGSHARAGAAFLARSSEAYRFPPGEYFAAHAEGTLGAILGCCALVCLSLQWRAPRGLRAALALTALAAHRFHRPWWWYYWLHFAIPLSMLSGMGLRGLARLAGSHASETRRRFARPLFAVAAISGLASHSFGSPGVPAFRLRVLRAAEFAGV